MRACDPWCEVTKNSSNNNVQSTKIVCFDFIFVKRNLSLWLPERALNESNFYNIVCCKAVRFSSGKKSEKKRTHKYHIVQILLFVDSFFRLFFFWIWFVILKTKLQNNSNQIACWTHHIQLLYTTNTHTHRDRDTHIHSVYYFKRDYISFILFLAIKSWLTVICVRFQVRKDTRSIHTHSKSVERLKR